MKNKKVLIGFSGGVDSAVSAYLLKKQGYNVVGCFMRNWDSAINNDILGNPNINDSCCPQENDYKDAVIAAKILNIKLLRVDFIKEYWEKVFSYFLNEYKNGRIPNPDVFCNKYIKFDLFLKFAKKKKFDFIATGHYAKKIKINNDYFLAKSKDSNKDQTYFLSQLNKKQIKSCLFPLSEITKKKVRQIAKKLKLNIANKKDSTGICFIGERNFKKFLSNYLPIKKGKIININNNHVIGTHDGAFFYTIGQHKGLGIGGLKEEENKLGWIVVKKNIEKNIIYVDELNSNKFILSNRIIVKNINLFFFLGKKKIKVMSKFKHGKKTYLSIIRKINYNTIEIFVPNKVKAISTGQFVVFYKKNIMFGSGIVYEVYLNDRRLD